MYATLLFLPVLLAIADRTSGTDLVPFEEAGKWGFKDTMEKIVVEAKYDEAGAFSSGLAPVNVGARVEQILHPPAKTGGKWGYVDARGTLVVPITLDGAHEFSDGLARVYDDHGTRYLDPSGKVVIDLGPVRRAGDFHEGVAPTYEDRSLAGKGWRTKFIDKKGLTVFSVDGYADEFQQGMAVLAIMQEKIDPNVSNERQLYGYIDRRGKLAIPPRFSEALAFHEGFAAVRPRKTTVWRMGDSWGYNDTSGEFAIQPQFNEAHPFRNGIARVHVGGTLQAPVDTMPFWEGGQWRLIDRTGKVLKRSTERIEYPQTDQAAELVRTQAAVSFRVEEDSPDMTGFVKHCTLGSESAWFNGSRGDVLVIGLPKTAALRIAGFPKEYGGIRATGWEDGKRFFVHASPSPHSGT